MVLLDHFFGLSPRVRIARVRGSIEQMDTCVDKDTYSAESETIKVEISASSENQVSEL